MIYNSTRNTNSSGQRRKDVKYKMAATETVTKVAVNILVNNGTTQTGALKTASISMGAISTSGYDADKAIAIADLISDCLTKDMCELRKVEYSRLLSE